MNLTGWQHTNCPHGRCQDRTGDGCWCDRRRLAETDATADWSMSPQVWSAVLSLAEREAQYTDRPESHHVWKRNAARRWIFHGGGDFSKVCELAGWNPDVFRERMRGILDHG